MDTQITYNLSNIPGFLKLVLNDETSPDEKYYSSHLYTTKANNKYRIVRYNKDFLYSDVISTYGLLRSVILSREYVVCFSPPKTLSGEYFMSKYPKKTENIVAEEFIEGTMINVFYDPTIGCWQIATRNTVGAEVVFYKWSNKTFNQMFFEACEKNNLNIDNLNSNNCYSFVLQHPENRIVVPFKQPQLYLVGIYRINQEGDKINVTEDDIPDYEKEEWKMSGINIKFPERYEFSSYTELIEKFASGNTPYNILGVIVKNTITGERTKFRNPIYEEVRHLKGNQPKMQYQYLCLRHSGRLPQFLKYYPETKDEMTKYREQVHMFTENLHKNYVSCYVKKQQKLGLYPPQYRTHMFKLHEHFTTNLRPNGLHISNSEVIKYVNNLHPSLLMYCLNYNMRKRMIDTIKVDATNEM